MTELRKLAGVNLNPDLIEELVKKHFGAQWTSRMTWDFVKGRFAPSDLPRRIVAPQRVFGLRIGWKTLGEFTDNLGLRLELWDPAFLAQGTALVEEYNTRSEGPKLELCRSLMPWPASQRAAA
ncbi:MAG TPA: hypothetical protein VN203_18350 [Candidatus Acidoferrum sp.]|nr:hypothetical protein [Candidatus Acidoferrum sp.]